MSPRRAAQQPAAPVSDVDRLALYEEGERLLRLGYRLAVTTTDDKGTPKRPYNPDRADWGRWQDEAIADEETLHRRLEAPETRGLGIVTTGLAAIDIDDGPGKDGSKNLRQWSPPASRNIVATPMEVATMNGGRHLYYREHPDHPVTNSGGELGNVADVDVRGRGGFIVVPPTSHGDQRYTWTQGPVHIDELPLSMKWLSGALTRSGEIRPVKTTWDPELTDYGRQRVDMLVREVAAAKPAEGENTGRHQTLIVAATSGGHLVAEGIATPQWVLDSLRVACGPVVDGGNGLADENRRKEIDRTIRDGILYALKARRDGTSRAIKEVETW
jgi:hypothetical protein